MSKRTRNDFHWANFRSVFTLELVGCVFGLIQTIWFYRSRFLALTKIKPKKNKRIETEEKKSHWKHEQFVDFGFSIKFPLTEREYSSEMASQLTRNTKNLRNILCGKYLQPNNKLFTHPAENSWVKIIFNNNNRLWKIITNFWLILF